ncbi:MAG: hypothetical protein ACM3MF_10085 [Anaerolineae bacterium]
MTSKSTLPALLLIVVLPMFACRMLQPAQKSCRVNMPETGWILHRNGDTVRFKVDAVDWSAKVDCSSGHLVEGEPARPQRAKEFFIPVGSSTYRLITSDPNVTMTEHHKNGSHIRIDAGAVYYLVNIMAVPGARGNALVSYFMGGQAEHDIVHLYCYNRTEGDEQTSLPGIAAMWTVDRASTVSLVCSGKNFVLEASTDITADLLSQGPTPVPVTPVPTITPEPPGWHF